MLTKDKRTVRKILTIDGFQEIKRYRLYAINKDEYPNSIERCKELYGDTSNTSHRNGSYVNCSTKTSSLKFVKAFDRTGPPVVKWEK